MAKTVDITGQKFGLLTALNPAKKDNWGRWMWLCRCDCGAEAVVSQNNLKFGNSRSCGHLKEAAKKSIYLRRPNNSGPDHYRWITDRSFIKWREWAVRKWAARAVAVNGGCCLKCGSHDRVQAHHADGWVTHPHRRLDPTNGVPLCSTHHREYHRIYGRDGSRQEDLHEYLGYPPIEREVVDTEIGRPETPNLASIYDLVVAGHLDRALASIECEIARRKAAR